MINRGASKNAIWIRMSHHHTAINTNNKFGRGQHLYIQGTVPKSVSGQLIINTASNLQPRLFKQIILLIKSLGSAERKTSVQVPLKILEKSY